MAINLPSRKDLLTVGIMMLFGTRTNSMYEPGIGTAHKSVEPVRKLFAIAYHHIHVHENREFELEWLSRYSVLSCPWYPSTDKGREACDGEP